MQQYTCYNLIRVGAAQQQCVVTQLIIFNDINNKNLLVLRGHYAWFIAHNIAILVKKHLTTSVGILHYEHSPISKSCTFLMLS